MSVVDDEGQLFSGRISAVRGRATSIASVAVCTWPPPTVVLDRLFTNVSLSTDGESDSTPGRLAHPCKTHNETVDLGSFRLKVVFTSQLGLGTDNCHQQREAPTEGPASLQADYALRSERPTSGRWTVAVQLPTARVVDNGLWMLRIENPLKEVNTYFTIQVAEGSTSTQESDGTQSVSIPGSAN